MKFITPFYNLINAFKIRFAKNTNAEQNIINKHLQSDELEKKLALLIKDIENVNKSDLKQVEYKKMERGSKIDLFTFYRLDFHTRDELYSFKKKYRSLLL